MIAQSQSGTGKTAAFCLTMLSRVNTSNPWPQVRWNIQGSCSPWVASISGKVLETSPQKDPVYRLNA